MEIKRGLTARFVARYNTVTRQCCWIIILEGVDDNYNPVSLELTWEQVKQLMEGGELNQKP